MDSNEIASHSHCKQWLAALAMTLPMATVGNLEFVVQICKLRLLQASGELSNMAILITYFGCVIGAIFGAIGADMFGRRRALLLTVVYVLVGVIGLSSWTSASCIAILLIAGVNAGIALTVVPLYISEIADSKIRGSLLMLQLVGIYAGQLLLRMISFFLFYDLTYVNAVLIALPLLFLVAILWFPESPYYLASKKQYESATKSLAFFKGIGEFAARQELDYLISSVEENSDNRRQGVWLKFLQICCGRDQKGLMLMVFLIIVQWNRTYLNIGYNLDFALKYITTIPLTTTGIIVPAIRMIWSAIIALTIDYLGRRSYLLGSTLAGLLVTIFAVIVIMDRSYILFFTTFFLELCQIVICGVSLVYVGELFSTNVNSIASATVTIFAIICKCIIFVIFDLVPDVANYEIYFFIPIYLLAFIFVLVSVPETKRNTFTEIQNSLADNKLKCRFTKPWHNPLLRAN